MVRVIVVDDEPLARQAMRQLLRAHPSIELAGEADSVASAAKLVEAARPDAIFLDIEMSDFTGFELLRQLATPPKVIFVTAHAQHAVQAFEFDAVDYLLKPVGPDRLADAVTRLNEACTEPRRDLASRLGSKSNFLRIKTQTNTIISPFKSVIALVAAGDFTNVLIQGEPRHMVGQMLGKFESLLRDPPFIRLGRSLIINSERLRGANVGSRDETKIWLDGAAEPFILGRAATAKLKRLIPSSSAPAS